jgi:hypothetical protein
MQRSTHQLVTPAILNAAAISLLLATFVSSGFLPGVWATPPNSFGVPPVPPDDGSEASGAAVADDEDGQGGGETDIGVLPEATPGSGQVAELPSEPSDDVPVAPAEASAEPQPGLAPDPLAAITPTPELNNEPPAPADAEPPTPAVAQGPAPEGQCAFRANDIELGRAVRRRRAARVEQPFVSDGLPVFAWVDLHNRDEAVVEARVRWTHIGTGHSMESPIEMRVGNHWQVIVEQRLPATMLGEWRIDVVDPADCIVLSRLFQTTAIGWELEE